MNPDLLVVTGINVLLAWSAYVAMLAGTLSFAQVAFAAIGAYGSGVLTVRYGAGLPEAFAAGALLAGIAAAGIGWAALRTRGLYLALVTVGVVFIVRVGIENTPFLGGVAGLSGMTGATPWHVGAAVLAAGLLLWWLQHSPLQRVLDALRDDEHVAASLGIDARRMRLAAFVAGAVLASVAGSLYAHYVVFISPDAFDIQWSIFVVLYVVLGGANNMWGAPLGAVVMTVLSEEFAVFAAWRPTIFGAAVVVLLLLRPEGLLRFRTPTLRAAAAR